MDATNRPSSEAPPCPVCGGRRFRRLFVKHRRQFWRCRDCCLQRVFPLPSEGALRSYYDGSYRRAAYKEFAAATEMKRLTAQRRLAGIMPYYRGGRWLDVGCSNGIFVRVAAERGMRAEGIDFSQAAVELARQQQLPVSCSTVEEFRPEHRFDTLTGFDVLEHVVDPPAFLAAAHRLLVSGGTLALSLPNLRSLSRMLMRRCWYFYNAEEHLHYFNPSTIRRLLARSGFDVLRCRGVCKPLTFDYALIQLRDHNPAISAALAVLGKLLPRPIRRTTIPVPIGEMTVIAKRED